MALIGIRAIERYGIPTVFLACSLPLALLIVGVAGIGPLAVGPNPVEDIQDTLGIWGLRLLLATLAVTPLSWWVGAALVRIRRTVGLFAYAYVALHFLNYVVLDQTLGLSAIIEDVLERPFITIGFAALLALTPLAITSTNAWRRRLGRNWKRLHWLIYPASIAACWHFYWQVKKDVTEPLVYSVILALLLGMRLVRQYRRKSRRT